MKNLTENQKRIIDEITNEFLSINEKKTNRNNLIDLDSLFKEKKEWGEKLFMLMKKNGYLLSIAKDECQTAFEKLKTELFGIAEVSVKYSVDYGGAITIKKGTEAFRIKYEAPHTMCAANPILGETFIYADKFVVSGYVDSGEVRCNSTEEFFSNEYVKHSLYKLLK
jgi:hypothetical protein